MKILWLMFGIVFLLTLSMLGGCGIAQEQYDAMVADLNKAQQELQTTKANLAELTSSLEKAENELKAVQEKLETAETKYTELTASLQKAENELEAKESELETTTTEYESFKTDAKNAWGVLDNYLAVNHEVLGINAGLCLEDMDIIYQNCTDVDVQLAALGNEALQSYWEEAFITDGEEWHLYYGPYERFLSKLAQAIKSIASDIRGELI